MQRILFCILVLMLLCLPARGQEKPQGEFNSLFNLLPGVAKAREAAIAIELAGLEAALHAYRAETGEFPPDGTNPDLVVRHLRKVYPRLKESSDSLQALAEKLDPAEALAFWLGGLKDNPEFPLTGAGEVQLYYEFDKMRLADADEDGLKNYFPANAPQVAYLYFMKGGTGTFLEFNVYKAVKDDFQIISAGQDGKFGKGGATYPEGPYSKEEQDNLTSFSDGSTLTNAAKKPR